MQIKTFSNEELDKFCEFGNFKLDKEEVAKSKADKNIAVTDNGEIVARASVWIKHGTILDGKKTGFIGHFSSLNETAAFLLLDFVNDLFRENNVKISVGPLDGSTWKRYRFIVEDNENPFFMEPNNSLEWPDYFKKYGYKVIATYYSALVNDLNWKNKKLEKVKEKKIYKDIEIKNLDKNNFIKQIEEIYELSIRAFKNNFLYSEISKEEFLNSYVKVKDIIDYELVFLAYKKDRLIGFVFAYPDFNEKMKNGKTDRVILKSFAVDPDFQGFGLGSILAEKIHETAFIKNYKKAIHALIHENNKSKKISENYGKIIRKYELYEMEVK